MSNYKFSELVVYKEATENEIPTSPKALKMAGVVNFDVKDTQKSETNATLSAGGQASKKDYGTSDYAGNIECKMMGDNMPFIATHVLGQGTKEDATADDWEKDTTYTKFDPYTLLGSVVNHSDGVHTLVCKVAGTSDDSDEPDLTGKNSGDTVADNEVTWIVRKKLYKYTGESEPSVPTFGAEFKATSSVATDFVKRLQGNFLNSYEISKSNGTIIHKYSLPVVAMSSTDNVSDTDFTSIKDETGYAEQDMTELPFGYDDLRVEFDGLQPVDARNFTMTINRNTSVEDAVTQGVKVSNTPAMECSGSVGIKFTKALYEQAFKNEVSEVKCSFGKQNGDLAHFTFRNVGRDRSDPSFTSDAPAYLDIQLAAFGDPANKTIAYTILSEIDY